MKRQELRRLAGAGLIEPIREARALLEAPAPSDEAVHQVRKALKNTRAALRLLRDAMADTAPYREQNLALRDAGRRLAPLRESKMLGDAFAGLRERYARRLEGLALGSVQTILRAGRGKARRQFFTAGIGLPESRRLLDESLRRAELCVRDLAGSAAPAAGLRRVYRKGRKAFAEARKRCTPEAFHEWRKQVKYLANSLELLRTAGKPRRGRTLERAEKLAERLGEHHDLAALSRETSDEAYAAADAEALGRLRQLIGRRCGKLERRAFVLGEKVYRRKPKRFA